jgi:hypothetical protein
MRDKGALNNPADQAAAALPHVVRRILPAARQIAGWCCIAAGFALLVLPGPGVLLLLIGVALLGRRNLVMRRLLVGLRRQFRRWARCRDVRGRIGIYGLGLVRELRGAHTLEGSKRR